MPRDTSNSGRTGMGGSMSGGGWGGFGGSGSGGSGGGGGWGGNLRGADGMTASQRAQTRDSRLGLQTGNTWHGNTAFGRPGQQAYGFATSSNQGATFGQRPTMQTFSNFRRPDGSAMFPGAGGSVQAPNAFAGAAMMQQQMRPPAGPQPVGGGVPGAPGYQRPPINPILQFQNYPYPNPAFAGGWLQGPNWFNTYRDPRQVVPALNWDERGHNSWTYPYTSNYGSGYGAGGGMGGGGGGGGW
jgi:hypothetical protein